MANLGEVLDKAGVAVLWNKIKTALGDKVDKVTGKGLSTNDYDNTEKSHVSTAYTHSQSAHAPSTAEKNVIIGVQKNGTDLTVDSTTRKVNVTVPTKTSELSNDSGFITEADVPEGASASTTTPLMDGTAAVGESVAFARGDHRHPTDTSRAEDSKVVHNVNDENVEGVKNFVDGIEFGSVSGIKTTIKKASADGDIDIITDCIYLTGIGGGTTGIAGLSAPIEDNDAVNKIFVVNNFVAKENGKGLSTNDYTTAEKNKLAAFDSADQYAKKSDITSMYRYKGSKASYADLPTSGNTAGDVWNVEDSGMNYAWTGETWDALGSVFSITAITAAEIDEICV